MSFARLCACLAFIVFVVSVSRPARAGVIEWHSSNLQLLRGWNYEIGDRERTILSFEHANRWTHGDFYMFVDGTRFDDGGTKYYAEFSPRISLGKLVGSKLSLGPVKDVLVTSTIEKGEGTSTRFLIGGAVDLAVPGFVFLKVNLYARNDPRHRGQSYQVTIAWKRPFKIGATAFLFEGFADFAGNEGAAYRQNEHIVPRLLADIGKPLGLEPGRLFLGLEFEYWHNKFGRPGVTDTVPQLQIKWVFD